jgi:Transglutaminase-like superfamily
MHQTLLVIRNGTRQQTQKERLPDGVEGNLRTLSFVRSMVTEDAAYDQQVRRTAQEIIAACRPGDFDCEVRSLFEYAQQDIRFVRDPIDVERIADAATTMAEGQGDCVDKSVLLATMLGSVGHLTRGKVVNYRGDVETAGFNHFYLEVQRPEGTWEPLDPTPSDKEAGWEAEGEVHRTIEFWEGTGGDETLSGLLDQILPGLIQTGAQLGSQWASSSLQQARSSGSQSQQLGAAFDQLAGQTTALFDSIQRQATITQADLQNAAAAYQQLAQVVQQYGGAVPYIAEQWNSSAYKPAYEARLQQMVARVQAVTPGTNVPPSPGPTGNGSTTSPDAFESLTGNQLFWPLVVLLAVVLGAKALGK